jgi:hypothetical protein
LPPSRTPPGWDLAKFEATRRACRLAGWEYRLAGAPDPIATANLRWLAGYRHPRHGLPELTAALRAAFAAPTPLTAAAEAVGDPIAVLPVLFHLLRRHELVTDLSVPLHPCVADDPARQTLLRRGFAPEYATLAGLDGSR